MSLNYETFQARHLDGLKAGDEGFHGQLYPGVYPPDVESHRYFSKSLDLPGELQAQWDAYLGFVRTTVRRGVTIARLRTLPETFNDDTEGLIAAAQLVADAGETVRVSLFEPQVARMVTHGISRVLRQKLQAPVPKAGIWSFRAAMARTSDPGTIVLMDYNQDGGFDGFDVHLNPSRPLIQYEHFWRNAVFGSTEHSVPLEEWRQLYD